MRGDFTRGRIRGGGSERNRTAVYGFAIRCITTLPPSQKKPALQTALEINTVSRLQRAASIHTTYKRCQCFTHLSVFRTPLINDADTPPTATPTCWNQVTKNFADATIPAGLPFLFAQNLGKRLEVNHHRPQSQHNGEEQNGLCKPAPVFISVREND